MEVKDDRIASSPASPSSKKRRSVLKRVVSVPAAEVDGGRMKGGGEAAPPPSDSWAWRKYGQKPIKGSPYPRGYYRCSSSKGCPARKQVERSRVDPTTFTVTYSLDHDHTLPFQKNHHHQHRRESTVAGTAAAAVQSPKFQEQGIPYASPGSDQEKLCDPTVENPAGIILPEDFPWFAEVGSPSGTSPTIGSDAGFFCGPILRVADANVVFFDDCEEFSGVGAAAEEEEDGLFAGLGDLPECSIVFRRGFLERQWRGGGDRKRCGIEVEGSPPTTSSWCGRTR